MLSDLFVSLQRKSTIYCMLECSTFRPLESFACDWLKLCWRKEQDNYKLPVWISKTCIIEQSIWKIRITTTGLLICYVPLYVVPIGNKTPTGVRLFRLSLCGSILVTGYSLKEMLQVIIICPIIIPMGFQLVKYRSLLVVFVSLWR